MYSLTTSIFENHVEMLTITEHPFCSAIMSNQDVKCLYSLLCSPQWRVEAHVMAPCPLNYQLPPWEWEGACPLGQ